MTTKLDPQVPCLWVSLIPYKRWLNHFPAQTGPLPNYPFSEKTFPNAQSEPLLMQLEAISLSSEVGTWEETNS